MKQKLLLKAMLLLCALVAGSSSVWATEYTKVMECDLTGKSYGTSSYNTSTAYGNWTIVNGANNNKGWAYFKMGGKSATIADYNPCYIYSTVAATDQVDKITVHIPAGSLSKTGMSVKSWGVYVYSSSTMTTVNQVDYVAGGTITNSEGSFDFTPSAGKTWAKDYYYKVSWDLANTTTTNGIVCVDKITLYKVAGVKHTATFNVNGEVSSADFEEGADIEFPAVSSVGGMKLIGWTTSTITGTQNSAPATLLSSAKMSTSDITYYAVFAYKDAGKYVLDYSEESALSSSTAWGSYGTAFEYTANDGGIWVIKAYKSSGMQINNSKDCSIKIPTCPSDIKSINITCAAAKAVGFSASDYSGSGTISYIVSGSDATSQTLDFTEKSVKSGYIVPKSGNTQITKIEVIYSNSEVIKDYCTTVPTATITLNAACTDGEMIYGTYSNSSAFIVPAGLTVSEVGVTAGKLVVTKYNGGSVVPAGTGVLVSATTAGDKIVALTSATGTAAGAGNLLHGTGDADITASDMETAAPSCKYYRLTMHEGTQIGFWWGAASGAAFDLAANKAYLAVPTGAGAPSMLWFDNGSTGVDEVRGKMEEVRGDFFDLQGRKVANPTKGLYIVNGKKVVIK